MKNSPILSALLGLRWLLLGVGLLLLMNASTVPASQPEVDPTLDLSAVQTAIQAVVTDGSRTTELVSHATRIAGEAATRLAHATGQDREAIRRFLVRQMESNLRAKQDLVVPGGDHFTLTPEALRRTVLEYEAFKLESFVTSGVFPKRYFGYFDGKWDTADHERTLRETVHRAVAEINAYQARRGRDVRLTDLEVAITFIAEGGAILLRENQSHIDDYHPVQGIGLDSIADGFARHPGLVTRLDEIFGSGLAVIVCRDDANDPTLVTGLRNMDFVEGILGTAVMCLYEKEIAERKLRERDGVGLAGLPPADQFIYSSLVYNSGILFAADRIAMVRSFGTAAYLYGVTVTNQLARPRLPVLPSREALASLLEAGCYPEQPTSWSAIYHILQRYGGYVGMKRFTDVFDEKGMFRPS